MTAPPSLSRIPRRDQRLDARLDQAFRAGRLPKELLVVGPAGTGKTFPILTFLHVLAARNADLRILVCRQTRASLTNSVLVTFEQEVLPNGNLQWISAGASRTNRSHYAYPSGSEIALGGLDKPDRILSTAWDVVYVNEAIEVSEDAWDALSSRLDRPGRPRWLGHLIGDTNPGDPGHWLKKRCDDGRTALWETTHRSNPFMHDGAGWAPAGLAYLERLDRLRGTRRKRLKDGLWAAGEGQWFSAFDSDTHVSTSAEFDPNYPVHLAVDTGVHVGAVWFQVREGGPGGTRVTVFADYYSYDIAAYVNAQVILAATKERCRGRFDVGRYDPSGGDKTGLGAMTIKAEFDRAGLLLHPWPKYPGCIAAGLGLVDSFVSSDPPGLTVHPRCRNLVDAFANYKRKKRGGQYIDEPEDPQHPYEEVVDALRSGLLDRFPEGRRPEPKLRRVLTPGGRFR